MAEGELNNDNKGTSKRHKMNEKSPILQCTFLHQYLEFPKKNRPLHPAPFQKCCEIIKIPMQTYKRLPRGDERGGWSKIKDKIARM